MEKSSTFQVPQRVVHLLPMFDNLDSYHNWPNCKSPFWGHFRIGINISPRITEFVADIQLSHQQFFQERANRFCGSVAHRSQLIFIQSKTTAYDCSTRIILTGSEINELVFNF
jgi:hypothetical protein